MKNIIILLFLCNVSIAQPPEFEGIKFGSSSESFKGLKFRASKGPIASYNKENDALIKKYLFLSEVTYSFNDNGLYMIILTSVTDRMIPVLKQMYGNPNYTPDGKMYWERGDMRINSEYKDGTYAWFVFDKEQFKKLLIAMGATIK